MKKILLLLIALGIFAAATGCLIGATLPGMLSYGTQIKGSGKIVSRSIDASRFQGIKASRTVKVVIADTPSDKILIEADDNLIDEVTVQVKNNVLHASVDKRISGLSGCSITVTVPRNDVIGSLDASSAASIVCETPLPGENLRISASSAARVNIASSAAKCRIEASSAAKIDAALETEQCELSASSAAKVRLSGHAGKCRVELDSAAKCQADELIVTDYRIETSSAAKAAVRCEGTLRAEASSGSSIRYTGDCRTDIEQSSGGSVRRK